jgi:hypothetical protein
MAQRRPVCHDLSHEPHRADRGRPPFELVDVSCACGFVPKGELSGDMIAALLT